MYLIFLISICLSLVITPFIMNIGTNFGLYDKPDFRRKHTKPTPRIGGLAIFCAGLFSFLIYNFLPYDLVQDLTFYGNNKIIPIFFMGLLTFFFIGLSDDIFTLSPIPKLLAQLIFSSILWFVGLRIDSLDFIFRYDLNNIFSLIFTIVWIAGVTNAINWLDGLDGLASGVTSISFLSLSAIAFHNSNSLVGIISLILAGSCIGFLMLNFSPAKIFMGDGGSFLLGFSVAGLSILGCSERADTLNLIPSLIILFIPLFDMTRVIIKRIIKKRSPFFPDRIHFHHIMIDYLNLNEKQIFIIYVFFTQTSILIYLYSASIIVNLKLLITTIFIFIFLYFKEKIIKAFRKN